MSALPAAHPGNLAAAVEQALCHPLPGSDPDAVRLTARQLAGTAEVLRSALARVRTLGQEQSFWVGAAAVQFADLAGRAPKHIDAVADRYQGYAAVLRSYAVRVETIRTELALRRSQLQTAWSAYQSAAAAVRTMAGPIGVPPCGPTAAPGPESDEVIYRHRRVADAFNEWNAAASAAAHALSGVNGHNALHNPHGLHAFVDDLSAYAGDISSIASVAGVIALVVCPVLAPVLFAVATAAAAAKTAADVDRKIQYSEDVDTFDFADDALAIVPASGLLRAGRVGIRATGETAMHSSPYVVGAVRFGADIGEHLVGDYTQARTSVQLIRDRVATDPALFRRPPRPSLAGSKVVLREQGENVLTTALGLPGISIGTEKATGMLNSGRSWIAGSGQGGVANAERAANAPSVQVSLPQSTGDVRALRVVASTRQARARDTDDPTVPTDNPAIPSGSP